MAFTISDVQRVLREKTGIDKPHYTISQRTDRFIPDIARSDDREIRLYTTEDVETMVKVFALLEVGIPEEQITDILNKKVGLDTITGYYLTAVKTCNYISTLFPKGVKKDD